MNKLISKIVYFFIVLITFVILIVISLNYYINKNALFVLKKEPKYVVLGNSHPEFAYNDSLISEFSNLGKSGESYFYSYVKLKKILSQNKSISIVFLEFDNNQIDKSMNDWIWGEKYIKYRYPIYAPFMGFEENQLLLRKNFPAFQHSFALAARKSWETIFKSDFNYTKKIGGYTALNKSEIDSLISAQKKNTEGIAQITDLPIENFRCINKILNLCKSKNVTVYLIRSPLHPKYKGYRNEKIFLDLIKTKFPRIEFLDFSKYNLEDSEFADLEHLNYKGAKKFSLMFNELLQQGLMDSTDKQLLINNKIRIN